MIVRESLSRRRFVQTCSLASLGMVTAQINPLHGQPQKGVGHSRPIQVTDRAAHARVADPELVRRLALHAVDAARTAGATYADVRLTRTISQGWISPKVVMDWEELAVGVRVLVNGAWGFAASPFWKIEEMATLAQNAVAQARSNNVGTPQHIDLGTIPVVSGAWTMPVRYDPFTIPVEEKQDFQNALARYIREYGPGLAFRGRFSFWRQERAVASTDGMYVTQTVYNTSSDFSLVVIEPPYTDSARHTEVQFQHLTPGGRGWELFLDAKLMDQLPQLIAQAHEINAAPLKPVDIGRYDIVFDAPTMTGVLDKTVGLATELDRALGYEANAGGTSYLGPDPLEMLDTAIGASEMTVIADRSMLGGVATVQWDDEGVVPQTVPLVQNGVLMDYQTTREQAAWLAPWYEKRHLPVRSHGYAAEDSAMSVTLQHTPNLVLEPRPHGPTMADLIANTTKGLAVFNGGVQVDFQARNGFGAGPLVREISHGKVGAIVQGAGWLFNSLEIWKNLITVGDPTSVEVRDYAHQKGQPVQQTTHSVSAVPALIKNVAVIDMSAFSRRSA